MSSKPPQSRVRWEKLRGTVSQSIRFNQYFFSNMKHTNPERDVLLLWAGEHIGGNCGSAASGGILWRSPERPSHARTKGAVLYVTKPVKIRRIKEPESRQSHGAPTHPSPQSAETREADKVGHQLFILLWCTSTYQVWSRRYWFHLAEASTPPPARLYWNHCRPRKRRLRAITQIVPRDWPAACIFHEGSPVLG